MHFVQHIVGLHTKATHAHQATTYYTVKFRIGCTLCR